jgi:hypothetical protein
MKLLIGCFLALVGTSLGTFFASGTLQQACQGGFVLTLALCCYLWWAELI